MSTRWLSPPLARWFTVLGFAALGLAGCGGHQALQTPQSPEPAAEAKPWTRSTSGAGRAPNPAPASARAEEAEGSYAPERDRAADSVRPGLATSWGETLHSPTRSVGFERANGDEPFDVSTLYYDDWSGAQRMAAYGGARTASVVGLGGGAVTVSIADSRGSVLDGFLSAGRTIAIGSAGAAYVISIRNNTAQRFEIVATVDGLDVIDGDDGDLEKPGYILSPWQTLVIDGFRQSQNSVAAFRFGSVGESYAASQGKAHNVGVIGVAMFTERGSDYPFQDPDHDRHLRDAADPFPGRYARPPVWR